MSNGKYIVRVTGDGEILPKEEWLVHCGEDYDGQGFLCGEKNDYYDKEFLELSRLNIDNISPTTKAVSCHLCIKYLEIASDYKKKNGKWY